MNKYTRTAVIALLWLFAIAINVIFIVAMETVLPHRIILKWVIIFSFTYTWVYQFDSVTQKLKKSPRNGNSSRGHR